MLLVSGSGAFSWRESRSSALSIIWRPSIPSGFIRCTAEAWRAIYCRDTCTLLRTELFIFDGRIFEQMLAW